MIEPYATSIGGAISAYRDNKPWNGERPIARNYSTLTCYPCGAKALMFEVKFPWGSWFICERGHIHETTDGKTPAQAAKEAFR